MRKTLLAALLALGVLAASHPLSLRGFSVQCGGTFTPTLACTIPGLWNFTNPTTTAIPYPVPFQVGGVDATGVISTYVDLTNAQVLALNTTPVTVVAAPGVGKYVDVIAVTLAFNYTGAYTGPVNAKLYYSSRIGGNAASAAITGSGFWDATADIIIRVAGVPDNTDPPTTNLPVVIMTTSGVVMGGGNASNSVRVIVNYRIVATGL